MIGAAFRGRMGQGGTLIMPQISKEFQGQTVITTFETSPAHCFDLIDAVEAAYGEVIRHQPGFLAAGLHVNDARTRVCTYSQWLRREDYQAMLRTPEMRERNRHINTLCRSFEPVMYDVAAVFGR
jgi:quinol monooxygenase YgiN